MVVSFCSFDCPYLILLSPVTNFWLTWFSLLRTGKAKLLKPQQSLKASLKKKYLKDTTGESLNKVKKYFKKCRGVGLRDHSNHELSRSFVQFCMAILLFKCKLWSEISIKIITYLNLTFLGKADSLFFPHKHLPGTINCMISILL